MNILMDWRERTTFVCFSFCLIQETIWKRNIFRFLNFSKCEMYNLSFSIRLMVFIYIIEISKWLKFDAQANGSNYEFDCFNEKYVLGYGANPLFNDIHYKKQVYFAWRLHYINLYFSTVSLSQMFCASYIVSTRV